MGNKDQSSKTPSGTNQNAIDRFKKLQQKEISTARS